MDRDERSPLEPFFRKLVSHAPLDDADRDAVLALRYRTVLANASDYVLREGVPSSEAAVLVSGYAYRHKLAGDGLRQLVGILLPGEAIDIQSLCLDVADHNVQCLTAAAVAFVPREAIHDVMRRRPNIATAIMAGLCVEMSISREWVLNIGRRDALTRVAHFLCEFGARLDAQGLGGKAGYNLPMNQKQIGDATGLASVHVNRMLKALREKGLLDTRGLGVSYPAWEPMREMADFSGRYLFQEKLE